MLRRKLLINRKMTMKKILFVCIENSNRSQMAEAFGRMHAGNYVEVYSAGSKASGVINPKVIEAMSEVGYDLNEHRSETVDNYKNMQFEYVVSMGCGDDCPFLPAKVREDWLIPDPKHLSKKEFNTIRDYIEIKVKELIFKIS